MSAVDEEADDAMLCCASCGRAEVDDVKLKICTACKLVKYCSVACQKNHRPQHKKACKKRAAEIRDDRLFTQNESYLGECPICCLPLPLDGNKRTINTCCCKYICNGCDFANKNREWGQGLEARCTYCREKLPKTDEEIDENLMKRVKVNDPEALSEMGKNRHDEEDYVGAFEYWTKAAALGHIHAHFNLSILYHKGNGVEKNMKKEIYHLEEAAIGGHNGARCNLGAYELDNRKYERAVKHFIIAANLGCDKALEAVKKLFSVGIVSKEDYEAALRSHQAAVDATKSKQREEAYAVDNLSPEEQRH